MKILHVIANLAPRYGGPSKACVEMAQAVARLGHQVSIYTTNQDGSGVLDVPIGASFVREGVEFRYFPIQIPKFWGTSIPLALALRANIAAFDVVHIHSLYLFHDAVAAYYSRKYGVPYLIRPHGTLDPFLFKRHRFRKHVVELLFEDRNFRNAAALHFTTEEEMRLARPHSFNTPGIVVPHGLEINEYRDLPDPGTFRASYPEVRDKKIVLFLGRITFKKGLDLLVRAFTRVASARDDVHLVIAGPDDEGLGHQVRDWLRQSGLAPSTTFTGMLQGDAKLAAFRDASMFVLPSYSENFGISVIEAMACNLPVVISDQVNIWREVVNGGAGTAVPCDENELAGAITNILGNPSRAADMGRKGRALVESHFQWSTVARQLEQAYFQVLHNRIAEKSMRPNRLPNKDN